ncbi:MAG: hypothetical protein ACLSVG_11005, partial [Clostridia bacterium]
MILQEIGREIEREYEARRRAAEHLTENRKTEIYTRAPEIQTIDRIINTLGILIAYSAMKRLPPARLTQDLPERY